MEVANSKIALIGVATDLDKVSFWEKQARLKGWKYVIVGTDTKYDWTSHGTKIKYIVDAISELPETIEYVLISDTYDSFVNVTPSVVEQYFNKFENCVYFGNDLKYYEWHKWVYLLFPTYFRNKLHNYFKLEGKGYYFQSGIIGGNRQSVMNFYKSAMKYVMEGRREQKAITLMLNENAPILASLCLLSKHHFAHLFTRLYLFNFRSIRFNQSNLEYAIDNQIPWVIHCPGALRPTITRYFWNYFTSYGSEKDWRISPFVRPFFS